MNLQSTKHAQPLTETQAQSNDSIESKFNELRQLLQSSESTNELFQLSEIEIQFRICLLENISEGAIFVDRENKIISWNRSAEVITGLASPAVLGTEFTPDMIGLGKSAPGGISDCPITRSIRSGKQTTTECMISGRSGREANIELTVVPVLHAGTCHGCVVLLKDLTANADLKRELTDLKNTTSLDPLTHVANRTTFEKSLREYVHAHRATNTHCSLIVCDIDFFKKVNDTYGHAVGDEALVVFAQTLTKFVRTRDIVARYGGEEFVILCANCDAENAVDRAEQIRMSLVQTPQPMLDGKCLSASFGVSELRDSDDITSFFVRADKALYAAKKNGRNRVVKEGDFDEELETIDEEFEKSPASGICWRRNHSKYLFCEEYKTSTPTNFLADKLQGFIVETKSAIRKVEENFASLTILGVDYEVPSKTTHFRVDIEFCEADEQDNAQIASYVRIIVFPPQPRLFWRVYSELHKNVVSELRKYLMLNDESSVIHLNPAAEDSGRD
ncbi:MAG: diguanylate cyclase [Planctomycetota bacterium]